MTYSLNIKGGDSRKDKDGFSPADLPPSHGRSVILKMLNHMYEYYIVGQYDHKMSVWRWGCHSGIIASLFIDTSVTVLGWKEIL